MRLRSLFFLFFLLAPALPAVAADVCCVCQKTGDTEDVCLTAPSESLVEICGQNWRDAHGLEGWDCDAGVIKEHRCKPVANGGICQSGPKSALEVKTEAEASEPADDGILSAFDPNKKRPPAIIPKLNTPIPGFSFAGGSDVNSESSSLLAQYVVALYRYGISITAVAATVMFVYGAFQYLVGSAITTVQSGKRIMQEAVLGMVLVFGAVLLLRTVNSATLTLKALDVTPLDPIKYGADLEAIPQAEQGRTVLLPSGASVVLPSAFCRGDECTQYCEGSVSKKPVPEPNNGMVQQSDLVLVSIGPGLRSNTPKYMRPDAAEALTRAGRIAQGFPGGPYELVVGDTYRSFEKQLDAACKVLNGNKEREGAIASPGASPHGTGIAVDVSLNRNGVGLVVPFFPLSIQGEKLSQKHVETLEQIMVQAGFTHYCPEAWHYDFGRPETNEMRKQCPWPPIAPQR